VGNAAGPLSQPPRQIGPTSLCKTLSAKTATGDPSSGGILLSTGGHAIGSTVSLVGFPAPPMSMSPSPPAWRSLAGLNLRRRAYQSPPWRRICRCFREMCNLFAEASSPSCGRPTSNDARNLR